MVKIEEYKGARMKNSIPIPEELSHGLIFGDPKQIAALRQYEDNLEAEEKDYPKEFEVTLATLPGTKIVTAIADDIEEARFKALDGDFDDEDYDWETDFSRDYEIINIRHIGYKKLEEE